MWIKLRVDSIHLKLGLILPREKSSESHVFMKRVLDPGLLIALAADIIFLDHRDQGARRKESLDQLPLPELKHAEGCSKKTPKEWVLWICHKVSRFVLNFSTSHLCILSSLESEDFSLVATKKAMYTEINKPAEFMIESLFASTLIDPLHKQESCQSLKISNWR